MANANHTYVQYFIPTDGDSEEHPNVFLVKKPLKELRLGDVQAASASDPPRDTTTRLLHTADDRRSSGV